jgi:hypothetical protein
MSSLHDEKQTFFITSHSFLRNLRNVSDKMCRESQNTYFMFNSIFSPENGTVYEMKQKTLVQPDKPQITI